MGTTVEPSGMSAAASSGNRSDRLMKARRIVESSELPTLAKILGYDDFSALQGYSNSTLTSMVSQVL